MVFFYNSIDLDYYSDLEYIDGEKELKIIKKNLTMNNDTKIIQNLISEFLMKNNVNDFGIDVIIKEGTKEYFIVDLN